MLNPKVSSSIFIKCLKLAYNNSFNNFSFSTKKTVFLFGGQGNQQKGMLDKYLDQKQLYQLIINQGQKLEIDLLQISTTDKNNLINQTQYTQPLLLLSHYLQFYYGQKKVNTNELSYESAYFVGHSLGQYSSLMISGSISLSDCLKLVYKRGELMMKVSRHQQFGTLIVKFREDKLPAILQQVKINGLEVSCHNSPTNIVVSGPIDKLTKLKDYMKTSLRIVSKVLPVSTAFHSRHLQKMAPEFKTALDRINFLPPKYQVLRNIDCQIYKCKEDIAEGLLLQNTKPVLFMQEIDSLVKRQGKQNLQFIQIGHKQYLSRWADEVKKLN